MTLLNDEYKWVKYNLYPSQFRNQYIIECGIPETLFKDFQLFDRVLYTFEEECLAIQFMRDFIEL